MKHLDSSDPLPFTQLDRAVKAKAAILANAIGVTSQHALGSLQEFWDLNGDPRELEKLLEKGIDKVVLSAKQVELRFQIASGKEASPDLLSEIGFLEPLPEGQFRVRGMSRYFDPIKVRLERRKAGSAGGIASAKARKLKNGTAQPEKVVREPLRDLLEQKASNPEATDEAPSKQTRSKPEPNVEANGNLEDRGQRTESLKTVPAPKKPRESDLLKADFKELTGHEYLWAGAKDGVALADLKKTASIDEIRARWRKGLAEPVEDWASCRTVAQLRAKFNDLVSAAPKPKQVDPLDQRVM